MMMAVDFYNPYECIKTEKGRWYKTNFHVHCDGKKFPFGLVLQGYRDAGYDIIMHSSQGYWEDTSLPGKENGVKTYNGTEYVEKDGILLIGVDRFLSGTPQEVIDACLREGGFCILCHPNCMDAPGIPPMLPKEEGALLSGLSGMEIYNGCISRRDLRGSGLATDFWDEVLSSGKIVWGFANDDFHDLFEMNVGWTCIYASADDLPVIKQAANRGSMYASNGLALYDFSLIDGVIRFEADYPYYRMYNAIYQFIGKDGQILKEQPGASASYQIKGNEQYIRAQARAEDGSMIWCQPVLDLGMYTKFPPDS